jgi:hypothetical protein
MSRWRAAAIHLGISAVIAVGVLVAILGIWYPPPYFWVSRAETLVLLIIGVDLVLGPLLTLIVFDQRKRWLKFDLAVIALLQAGALVYGVHALYASRPAFLVAEADRITMIYAHAVQTEGAENATYQSAPKWGPELVALRVPDDAASISQAIELMMGGGGELRERLVAYAPFEEVKERMRQNARPATEFAGTGIDVDRPLEELRYVPVYCRSGVVHMLLDGETGDPVGATALQPGGS